MCRDLGEGERLRSSPLASKVGGGVILRISERSVVASWRSRISRILTKEKEKSAIEISQHVSPPQHGLFKEFLCC